MVHPTLFTLFLLVFVFLKMMKANFKGPLTIILTARSYSQPLLKYRHISADSKCKLLKSPNCRTDKGKFSSYPKIIARPTLLIFIAFANANFYVL